MLVRRHCQFFFDVAVFLLPSLVTGPSLMFISLLVLELWQIFCKELVSNPEIGNATVWVLSNMCRVGSNISKEKLLNAANFQVCSFYYFWVIKGKPRGVVKIHLPLARLNSPEILDRVEMGNTNSQNI